MPTAATDPGNWKMLLDDGLWVWDSATNATYFVYRQHYDNPYDEPKVRIIDNIIWAPDNDMMLVTVWRKHGKASVIVGLGGAIKAPDQYANRADTFTLHEYSGGAPLLDSQGFVVTSSVPGQSSKLAILRRDNQIQPIVDGAALGYWMQNAAQLPDGRYAFLGKPAPTGRFEDNATPLRLYVMGADMQPAAASGLLPGPVLFADWDLPNSRITVYVDQGRGYRPITLPVNRGG
jgi:hypothetical protein